MNNYEKIEEELLKKIEAKERKKKPKMKVSGKSVFKLAEIISLRSRISKKKVKKDNKKQ